MIKVILSFLGIVFADLLYVDDFMPYMFTKNDYTPILACLTLPPFVLANQVIFDYIKNNFRDLFTKAMKLYSEDIEKCAVQAKLEYEEIQESINEQN